MTHIPFTFADCRADSVKRLPIGFSPLIPMPQVDLFRPAGQG